MTVSLWKREARHTRGLYMMTEAEAEEEVEIGAMQPQAKGSSNNSRNWKRPGRIYPES